MENSLITRQLQKVIFLPINSEILTDSTYVEPFNVATRKDSWFDLSFWRKIKRWKSNNNGNETIYGNDNEDNFKVSIWKELEKCKKAGFQIIFFPEKSIGLYSAEIKSELHKLHENNSILAILENNSIADFNEAVQKFNINPHNSYIISHEPELLKNIAQHYHPMHPCDYPTELINLKLGFNLVLWNKTNEKLPAMPGFIVVRSKLITYFEEIAQKEIHIYSSRYLSVLKDKIIFVGGDGQDKLNQYILDNYEWCLEQAEQKGCSFIFFPRLLTDRNVAQLISEYLVYNYPYLSGVQKLISQNIELSPSSCTETLLELLNLPDFNMPALIRSRASILGTSLYQFSCVSFDVNSDLRQQFENYFNYLQPANDTSDVKFRLVDKATSEKENDINIAACPSYFSYADEKFDEEASKLSDEIIQKIELLNENGNNSLLAEIALHIVNKLNIPLPVNKTTQVNLKAIAESQLSTLQIEWTSKYNFQIVLPDFGNMIIEMPRLPKALYYFFIQHPEGVFLHSLKDYKDELYSIYSRISNLTEKETIKENINRLIDPFDNSLYVNCSRIKNAFVKVINDNLAKNYYITGAKGEAKKIILPTHYIKILNNY